MMDQFPLFPSKSEPSAGRDKSILHGSNKGNSVKSFLQKFQPGVGMCFYRVGRLALGPERAKKQGFNDLLLGFAAAAGSFGSGMIFAASGFGSLGLAGSTAAPLLLGLAVWWRVRGRHTSPARV